MNKQSIRITGAFIRPSKDQHGYTILLEIRNCPLTKIVMQGFNTPLHAIRWIDRYCAPGTPIYQL